MWTNQTSFGELDHLLTGPLAPGEAPVAGRVLRDALAVDGITPGLSYEGGGCWVFTVPTSDGGALWISDGMVRVGHPVEEHTGWTALYYPDPSAPDDGTTVYAAPDGLGFAEDTAACAEAVRTWTLQRREEPAPSAPDLAGAITAAADDQRESYPELSDAEAVEVVRRNFFVFEDNPGFMFNGAWGVSATAADPLEQAYARVIRAAPEELASALDL